MSVRGMALRVMLAVAIAWTSVGFAVALSEDCRQAHALCESTSSSQDLMATKTTLEKAVDLCPQDTELRVRLAETLTKLAASDVITNSFLLDVAVLHYQKVVEEDPSRYQAHMGLGACYVAMGLHEKALHFYQKALQCKPQDPEALQCLSRVQEARSNPQNGLTRSSEIVIAATKGRHAQEKATMMGFRRTTSPKVKADNDATSTPERPQLVALAEQPAAALAHRQRFTNIVFDEWSAKLNRKESLEQLEEIGKALSSKDLAELQFVVEGHTDNRGPDDRNRKLSWDRAHAVKQYLVEQHGITQDRVTVRGFGPTRPRVDNDTPANRLKNRRVEILFVEKKPN